MLCVKCTYKVTSTKEREIELTQLFWSLGFYSQVKYLLWYLYTEKCYPLYSNIFLNILRQWALSLIVFSICYGSCNRETTSHSDILNNLITSSIPVPPTPMLCSFLYRCRSFYLIKLAGSSYTTVRWLPEIATKMSPGRFSTRQSLFLNDR
jgi:hypothetical protein